MTDRAKMMLLMIRCGFMGDRRVLTRKGRGLIPCWAWKAYVRVRCEVDARFRARAMETLKRAERMTPNAEREHLRKETHDNG
jgi:hypothetical protein